MRNHFKKRTCAIGALAALLLAVGVAAATNAHHKTVNAVPVTYTVTELPSVTPAEAERAVASAQDLSTAFRVASAQVLPAVVAIENVPKIVAVNDRSPAPPQANPFGGRNPFEGTPFEDLLKDRGFNFEMPPAAPCGWNRVRGRD